MNGRSGFFGSRGLSRWFLGLDLSRHSLNREEGEQYEKQAGNSHFHSFLK
jgi:hypothetical protein